MVVPQCYGMSLRVISTFCSVCWKSLWFWGTSFSSFWWIVCFNSIRCTDIHFTYEDKLDPCQLIFLFLRNSPSWVFGNSILYKGQAERKNLDNIPLYPCTQMWLCNHKRDIRIRKCSQHLFEKMRVKWRRTRLGWRSSPYGYLLQRQMWRT